jgi:nucleoside-diphosphate-sugar epimerase
MAATQLPFKRALVTGGAGFIGSHIIEDLLGRGMEVVSVDNYVAGKPENLAPFKANPRFREMDCDITDYPRLRECFDGVDVVFHEAASKKTICLRDPRRDLEINAKGAFNILELARDFKVKKVVHASTGSVYGEAQYYPTDEKHPLNPTSYYGVSKLAGEKYALAFGHLYGLDVTVIRYFHVYGPRQEHSDVGGVVSIFVRHALKNEAITIYGDGTQQRSFTSVKDVVAANVFLATRPGTRGECYNCASGIKVTIRELADKVRALTGRPDLPLKYGDWTPGDIRMFEVDNRKLRGLGFEFKVPFDQGLAQTVAWLKDYFADRS